MRRLRLEVFSTRRRIPLHVTVGVDQGVVRQLISVADGVFPRGNSHQNTSQPIACRVTTWSRMEQRVLGIEIAVERNTLIKRKSSPALTVCIKESRCSTAKDAGTRLTLRGEQQR